MSISPSRRSPQTQPSGRKALPGPGPLVLALLALGPWAGAAGSQSPTPSPKATPPFKSFAVYALSRGKGVPPEAREALRKVREVVDGDSDRGVSVKVQTKRIGIEGETRICADYGDAKEAGKAFDRSRALVKGVDLVNLVAEPCDKPAPVDGQKEEVKP